MEARLLFKKFVTISIMSRCLIIQGVSSFFRKNFYKNILVVVGASPCYLSATKAAITNDKVKVSAQNCYKAEKGAFTGEVAPEMLK